MSDLPARLSAALSDRYRLERPLGEGGMATVYLAADLKHDRKVALKVLRPELAAVIGADRIDPSYVVGVNYAQLDVSPDDQQFLMVRQKTGGPPRPRPRCWSWSRTGWRK